MNTRELIQLGIPEGEPLRVAVKACAAAAKAGIPAETLRANMRAIAENPSGYAADPIFGRLALELAIFGANPRFEERAAPAPWKSWGEGLEPESLQQMSRACRLPVAAAGALMPDAHVGYGLPIGGVLATRNAVIPYAVGVDIACRMRMTVYDMPPALLESDEGRERLTRAIERETRFGVGAAFKDRREHEVMDADWTVSHITHRNKDKAWAQLGTSGSGNHFVEFGLLTITAEDVARRAGAKPASQSGPGSGWRFDLAPGVYLALLSHSGSRGSGAAVCDHYSKLAMQLNPGLPKELSHLAWLELTSQPGQEYWHAMNLMGRYAAANHECIHRHITRNLGAQVLAYVENHHNFAWKETHTLPDGTTEELIVHRKGATPADDGVLGVIPGSMAAPGFVVRGLGSAASLRSASHGAGRVMSRTRARETFAWGNVKHDLAAAGVNLISAGIDEVPGVYKDIHKVMALQQDLVAPIGRFDPRLVKMAPEGERPED